MKYSTNRINKSKKSNKFNSVSYNCYDIYYKARAHGTIKYTKIIDKEISEISQFIIKTEHNIPYEKQLMIKLSQI